MSLYEIELRLFGHTVKHLLSFWRHICITYDGFRDVYKLFVDGEKVGRPFIQARAQAFPWGGGAVFVDSSFVLGTYR